MLFAFLLRHRTPHLPISYRFIINVCVVIVFVGLAMVARGLMGRAIFKWEGFRMDAPGGIALIVDALCLAARTKELAAPLLNKARIEPLVFEIIDNRRPCACCRRVQAAWLDEQM